MWVSISLCPLLVKVHLKISCTTIPLLPFCSSGVLPIGISCKMILTGPKPLSGRITTFPSRCNTVSFKAERYSVHNTFHRSQVSLTMLLRNARRVYFSDQSFLKVASSPSLLPLHIPHCVRLLQHCHQPALFVASAYNIAPAHQ